MHQRRQTQIHIARVGSKEHMLTAHPARLLFKLSTRKWAAKKKVSLGKLKISTPEKNRS